MGSQVRNPARFGLAQRPSSSRAKLSVAGEQYYFMDRVGHVIIHGLFHKHKHDQILRRWSIFNDNNLDKYKDEYLIFKFNFAKC